MNIDNSLRLDKDATARAFGYKEGLDEGAFKIAPIVPGLSNSQYPSYARGAFYYNKETQRAPGADIKTFEWPTEDWTAYVCEEHPLKALIDRQNKAKSKVQGMVYSDPKTATKALKRALDQALCYKIISTVFSTTTLSGQYASPGVQWDLAGAVPFDDIQTWWLAFKDGCGMAPNGFAISDRLLTYLGEGVRMKYGATTGRSNLELIKESLLIDFGIPVDRFVILRAEYYASASTKFVSLVADKCLFFYTPPTMNDFEPALACTIVPNDSITTDGGLGVLPVYNDPDLRGEICQVVREYKVVIPMKYAGYMGNDCASSF